jgi:hypothetical protein
MLKQSKIMKKWIIKIGKAYIEACNRTWLDFAQAYTGYDIK